MKRALDGRLWLLAGLLVALIAAVLRPVHAAPLRYAVTLPNGCAVLACGLSYHTAGAATRLIELHACAGESTAIDCPRVFANGFEADAL